MQGVPEDVEVAGEEVARVHELVGVSPYGAPDGVVPAAVRRHLRQGEHEVVPLGGVVQHGVEPLRLEGPLREEPVVESDPVLPYPGMGEEHRPAVHGGLVDEVEEIQVVLQDPPVALRSEDVSPALAHGRVQIAQVMVAQEEHHVVRVRLPEFNHGLELAGGVPGGDLLPTVWVEVVAEENDSVVLVAFHSPAPEASSV